MFSRRRDPGLWTFDSVITSAELEYWDANFPHALDGYGGGAYSLQADMVIGAAPGKHFELAAPTIISGSLYSSGGIEAYGTMLFGGSGFATFDKDARFLQNATFEDETSFSAAAFFNNDIYLGDSAVDEIFVAATAHFYAPASFSGAVDFQGLVALHGYTTIGDVGGGDVFIVNSSGTYNGAQTFAGGATFSTPVTFSGTGKVRYRSKTLSVAGNQSVAAVSYDTVYVPPGLMTNGDIITIDDTGAADGMRICFQNDDTAASVGVQTPSGATLFLKNAAGSRPGTELERIAGAWRFIDRAKI